MIKFRSNLEYDQLKSSIALRLVVESTEKELNDIGIVPLLNRILSPPDDDWDIFFVDGQAFELICHGPFEYSLDYIKFSAIANSLQERFKGNLDFHFSQKNLGQIYCGPPIIRVKIPIDWKFNSRLFLKDYGYL